MAGEGTQTKFRQGPLAIERIGLFGVGHGDLSARCATGARRARLPVRDPARLHVTGKHPADAGEALEVDEEVAAFALPLDESDLLEEGEVIEDLGFFDVHVVADFGEDEGDFGAFGGLGTEVGCLVEEKLDEPFAVVGGIENEVEVVRFIEAFGGDLEHALEDVVHQLRRMRTHEFDVFECELEDGQGGFRLGSKGPFMRCLAEHHFLPQKLPRFEDVEEVVLATPVRDQLNEPLGDDEKGCPRLPPPEQIGAFLNFSTVGVKKGVVPVVFNELHREVP